MHGLLSSDFVLTLLLAHCDVIHAAHLPDHAFQFHESKCSRDPLNGQIGLIADFVHVQRLNAEHIQ